MATTIVPKRSYCLRTRDHSSKVLSETKKTKIPKPKLRKVTIVNKNIQEVNVSTRRLRPRPNKKNYCDDSKLLQKYVPMKQHDSIVKLEKLDTNKKIPIYKTLKSDKSVEEKNDIYDFKFDVNDTKEKLRKKKKKRATKKNINKTRTKVFKKTKIKKKVEPWKVETIQTIKESEPKEKEDICIKKIEEPRIDSDIQIAKESVEKKMDKNRIDIDIHQAVNEENEEIETSRIEMDDQAAEKSVKEEDTTEKVEISQTNSVIQSMGEITLPERTLNENTKQNIKKPIIISVENANNITVKKSTENSDIQPFRPKNIFDNKTSSRQSKNVLNVSSLTNTLSPIKKTSNNLDFASPWRSSIFPMFSQSKYFIQSTPNVSIEINNDNIEENKENLKINKENLKINKENTYRKNKTKKKKVDIFHKKQTTAKQLLTNQNSNKISPILVNKDIEQPAPSRISLGKIRTLLQEEPYDNRNNKQAVNESKVNVQSEVNIQSEVNVQSEVNIQSEVNVQSEINKSLIMQKEKHFEDYLNFSDTFDVMSKTERLSNIESNNDLLFVDLEPSYFSKPPQYSYKRKRGHKLEYLENESEREEEKKDAETHTKKKKVTKLEKEHQKRVNEWVKSINSTFQEIDNYDLLIE